MKQMKINYSLLIVNKITDIEYKSLDIKNISVDKNKLGCILSHLYCINMGLVSGYEKFAIFEDDIIFHKNFNCLFTEKFLNMKFDLLMLGACDFFFKENSINILNMEQNDDLLLYKPKKQALGAHGMIYTSKFARFLYEYKLTNKIVEFDVELCKFYNDYQIWTCLPNLVVCELSSTNLNHNYGPNHANMYESFVRKCFPKNFTYNNYNYITIDIIEYIKNQKINSDCKINSFEEMIDNYMKDKNITFRKRKLLKENVLNSNYTIEDIKNMII
jgi:GR25 family glycosyltransferase involved in LPS biosynthesis